MKYRLGLDIGIASVGWAVIRNNEDDEACEIISRGVRVFDVPEKPKDGGSLMAERRAFRSTRRTLRRRKVRIAMTRFLCESELGIVFDDVLKQNNLPCIYQIRFEALSRKLSKEELGRLLLHFIHRRGFKSNRKSAKTKEDGAILKGIQANQEKLKEKNYVTIGEYYYKEFILNKKSARNQFGNYDCVFTREQIEDEIKLIFSKQILPENFQRRFLEIFNKQISYDIGPGKPSPYHRENQYIAMLGKCKFDGEFRTYQTTFAGEQFRLWNNLNNLVLSNNTELTLEQKKNVAEFALDKCKITYAQIRKLLKFDESIRFKHLPYFGRFKENPEDKKSRWVFKEIEPEEAEKKIFLELKGRQAIKKGFGSDFCKLTDEEIDNIAITLACFHDEDKLRNELEQKIKPEYIESVLSIDMPKSKPVHLSASIIYKILPYMQQGKKYNEAMQEAGFNHAIAGTIDRKPKLCFNDAKDEIRNPVVTRAVSQTFKVINAIVDKYGSPQQVIIEVAREMAKNFKERNKIEKDIEENHQRNQHVINQLKEVYGMTSPRGQDIIKYRLAHDQNWEDPYGFGKKIDAERLFEPNYVQVDHIIPYSISFDDSFNNKVLVLTENNQNKGNRTPLQFLPREKIALFENWVNASKLNPIKKRKLKTIEPDVEGLKKSALVDTQYITKFLLEVLNNRLYVAPSKHQVPIKAIKGQMTSWFRKKHGLKKSRDNDEHHATDAVVIACFTDKFIKEITRFSQEKENKHISKSADEYGRLRLEPWQGFADDLKRLDTEQPISVSRMCNRKISGSGHDQTIRRYKDGHTISRVPLSKLKIGKDGEIENYFNPSSDVLLYNAIKQVLLKTSGEKELEKAFKDFRKPLSNGEQGDIVRKVKIKEKTSSYVKLENVGGVAANGDMIRIDVFAKNEKFYFIPIYAAEFYKSKLPSMDESYNFKFSIYPKDLIYIERESPMKLNLRIDKGEQESKESLGGYFYYTGADISTKGISIVSQNGKWKARTPILNLKTFKKMEIDILGNISEPGFQSRNTKTLVKPKGAN